MYGHHHFNVTSVPNIRQAVDTVKAAGYPIVTRAELPASQDVKDDLAYIENQKTSLRSSIGSRRGGLFGLPLLQSRAVVAASCSKSSMVHSSGTP